LTEVKTLEARINKAISEGDFLGVVTGKSEVPVNRNFKTRKELEDSITAQFQSLSALVARRKAIKSAITKANTTVLVTVGNVEMTIAEAVDLKQTLWVRERLLNQLVQNVTQRGREVEQATKVLDEKIERYVTQLYGADKKVDSAQTDEVKKAQYDQYGPVLVDPISSLAMINQLKADIDEVKLNLDFSLSEVNAKTTIEISY
jgi:hypothetical protein